NFPQRSDEHRDGAQPRGSGQNEGTPRLTNNAKGEPPRDATVKEPPQEKQPLPHDNSFRNWQISFSKADLGAQRTSACLRMSMCPFLKEFVKLRRFPLGVLRTGSARRGCRFFPILWPYFVADRSPCRSFLDSSRLSSPREVAIVLC